MTGEGNSLHGTSGGCTSVSGETISLNDDMDIICLLSVHVQYYNFLHP